jgi:hypothetical protein
MKKIIAILSMVIFAIPAMSDAPILHYYSSGNGISDVTSHGGNILMYAQGRASVYNSGNIRSIVGFRKVGESRDGMWDHYIGSGFIQLYDVNPYDNNPIRVISPHGNHEVYVSGDDVTGYARVRGSGFSFAKDRTFNWFRNVWTAVPF